MVEFQIAHVTPLGEKKVKSEGVKNDKGVSAFHDVDGDALTMKSRVDYAFKI